MQRSRFQEIIVRITTLGGLEVKRRTGKHDLPQGV